MAEATTARDVVISKLCAAASGDEAPCAIRCGHCGLEAHDVLSALGVPPDTHPRRVEIALWLLDMMEKYPGTGGMGKAADGTVSARYGDWVGEAPTLVGALIELRAALADDTGHLEQYNAAQDAGIREWRQGVLDAAADADATVDDVRAGLVALRIAEDRGIAIAISADAYAARPHDGYLPCPNAEGASPAAAVIALAAKLDA